MWIIIVGNPVDGLTYHGPFRTPKEATDWTEENSKIIHEWWLARLKSPKEPM